MPFTPRTKQAEVPSYQGGRMGVSAAPGSGKTHVLSALAARLVADTGLADDQEVLIVTLVNSAVENFSSRVDEFVKARGLLPRVGYRVRTLHGLAHDIVRERPALVGLADDFQIVDEREARAILRAATDTWLAGHPFAADDYLAAADIEIHKDMIRLPASIKAVGTFEGFEKAIVGAQADLADVGFGNEVAEGKLFGFGLHLRAGLSGRVLWRRGRNRGGWLFCGFLLAGEEVVITGYVQRIGEEFEVALDGVGFRHVHATGKLKLIGGAGGWGAGGSKAPTISKELWKLDLVNYPYKDLEPRLKAASRCRPMRGVATRCPYARK